MKEAKPTEEKKRGFFYKLFHLFGKKKQEEEQDLLQSHIEQSKLVDHSETGQRADKVFVDVEEDDSGIPKPKRIVSRAPNYVKQLDAKQYCDEFSEFMQDYGLSANKGSIRELFASVAASKLIIVKHENPVISERFIQLFSSFIGANHYKETVKSQLDSFNDLLDPRYKLQEMLTSAHEYDNRINIFSLKNVILKELETYFDLILDYSWNPLLPHELVGETEEETLQWPGNTWFFVIPSDHTDTFMSKGLAKSAITIELKAKWASAQDEVAESEKKLTFEFLTNYLEEMYDEYYIEEPEWKKIDQIEQYLKETSDFTMDNRLFRQLERYTSTYILCGGDPHEAMDLALYYKFLQVIKVTPQHKLAEQDTDLFQLFEKLFGLENLRKSKVLIKAIQEGPEEVEEIIEEETPVEEEPQTEIDPEPPVIDTPDNNNEEGDPIG